MDEKYLDRKVIKKWVIKEDESNKKLFADVQKRSLLKEKAKSAQKQLHKIERDIDYLREIIFESAEQIVNDSIDNYKEDYTMNYDESKLLEGELAFRLLEKGEGDSLGAFFLGLKKHMLNQ